jgi:hypothetical protein
VKTLWGTCVVEDVVACLPHFPMLALDILPSYGGGILPWLFISFMHSPSFVLGYEGWPLLHNFPFYSFSSAQEILPLTNFFLPSTNKFGPMLERGTSTCTLSSHLHFPCFMYSIPKKSWQGESLGSL